MQAVHRTNTPSESCHVPIHVWQGVAWQRQNIIGGMRVALCLLQYFKNLLSGRGLLNTDAGLLQSAETKKYVQKFAKKQSDFFLQYAQSLLKLSEFGVLLSPKGDIRKHCERVLDVAS
jgi:hypothetical protein